MEKSLSELDLSYYDLDKYQELIFCSNYLINVSHIVKTEPNGWAPFVIRAGKKPRVWLTLKSQDDKYIEAIKDSISLIELFEVSNSENGIQISVGQTTILEAGNNNGTHIEVYKFDLRPIGLNVYGDHKKLVLGNMSLIKGTMKNVSSLMGISNEN